MKKILLFFTALAIGLSTLGQSKYSIEINPFGRYDRYADFEGFETVVGGRRVISTAGLSYGLNINFRRNLSPKSSVYMGMGLYRHRISDIKTRSRLGEGNDRRIEFLSPLDIFFHTDRYAYNTMTANLGFEQFLINRPGFYLTAGAELNLLYTFSQYYHLSYNPGGSQDYFRHRSGFTGAFTSLDVSVRKRYGRLDVGPRLKLPVFLTLRTDPTFPTESGKNSRHHWFSGAGLGFSLIYHLKTKA